MIPALGLICQMFDWVKIDAFFQVCCVGWRSPSFWAWHELWVVVPTVTHHWSAASFPHQCPLVLHLLSPPSSNLYPLRRLSVSSAPSFHAPSPPAFCPMQLRVVWWIWPLVTSLAARGHHRQLTFLCMQHKQCHKCRSGTLLPHTVILILEYSKTCYKAHLPNKKGHLPNKISDMYVHPHVYRNQLYYVTTH